MNDFTKEELEMIQYAIKSIYISCNLTRSIFYKIQYQLNDHKELQRNMNLICKHKTGYRWTDGQLTCISCNQLIDEVIG